MGGQEEDRGGSEPSVPLFQTYRGRGAFLISPFKMKLVAPQPLLHSKQGNGGFWTFPTLLSISVPLSLPSSLSSLSLSIFSSLSSFFLVSLDILNQGEKLCWSTNGTAQYSRAREFRAVQHSLHYIILNCVICSRKIKKGETICLEIKISYLMATRKDKICIKLILKIY